MSTAAPIPQPANALEQRIYDLLRPFRDECFDEIVDATDESTAANRVINLERKALVPARDGVAKTGGAIAVLVRFPEGALGVVKATFEAGTRVVDALIAKLDEMLAKSF